MLKMSKVSQMVIVLCLALSVLSALVAFGVTRHADQKHEVSSPTGPAFCSNPVYDAGTVLPGHVIKHTFVVSNNSESTLKVKEVTSSCDCADVNLSNTQIPPGSTIDIETSIKLASRAGKHQKNLMVHFVDPDVPALALTVRALAQMPYVVEPARIDLEKVKPSASSTHQVNIKMNDGSPAYLQNTKASADWLRVTQSNDDEVATVNISVTTPLVSGSYNEDVDVTVTGKSGQFDITVPIHVIVSGGVELRPQTLVFDPTSPRSQDKATSFL